MEIIALAYKIRSKSIFDKSLLHVFIAPSCGGNDIVEGLLYVTEDDLGYYDQSLICDSYAVAHKRAYLSQMSESDYEMTFGHIGGQSIPFLSVQC
jgi:uncharacterized protein YbaR (Trm112 family)